MPATNAARVVGVDGAAAAGCVGVAAGAVVARVALSVTAGTSEKTKSDVSIGADVSDWVPVAAGSLGELGDAVVSASVRAAAEAASTVDAGAFADPWDRAALGSEVKFVGADSPRCSAPGVSDLAASVCGYGGAASPGAAPARPTLADIFPARRATTAASTIPAATIKMTNIS